MDPTTGASNTKFVLRLAGNMMRDDEPMMRFHAKFHLRLHPGAPAGAKWAKS